MTIFATVFLSAIVAMLVVQVVILLKTVKSKQLSGFSANSRYSSQVNLLGQKSMEAIERGVIKKQLLLNDAPEHSSDEALDKYIDFLHNTSVYKKIIEVGEIKYHG